MSSWSTLGARLALLTLFLLVAVPQARAAMDFGSYCKCSSQPSLNRPWTEFDIYFYDSYGSDSFFLHDKTANSAAGPALYINGNYICSPDWELAWPGGKNDGNDSGLKSECNSHSGWWGSTYQKTVNGISYTVKFHGPTWTNDKAMVKVVVYTTPIKVGQTITLRIDGYWKTNNNGTKLVSKSWTSNGMADPWPNATISAEMTANKTIKYSGSNFGTSYTTYVGPWVEASATTYSGAKLTKGDLKKYTTMSGSSSFSDLSAGFDDMTNTEWKNCAVGIVTEYKPVDSYADRGTYTVWKTIQGIVPGFAKPSGLSTTYNMWNKSITVNWGSNETLTKDSKNYPRSKAGTWTVSRYPEGNATDKKVLKEKIAYGTRTFTDNSVPAYDTKYVYEVKFVPSGATSSNLTATTTTSCQRIYEFTNLSAKGADKSIVFSWNCPALQGSENYKFEILRSDDGKKTWAKLSDVAVADKTKTSYSYTDSKDLKTCVTYYYKVRITMLESKLFDTPNGKEAAGALTGQSEITSLNATKGEYSSLVKLTWEANQVGTNATQYQVFRRLKGSNTWSSIYKTSGTATTYYFEDNTALPGQYYDYKVRSTTSCGTTYQDKDLDDDGFCRSTGVVSGRIAYGTGTAVAGVKVALTKDADGGNGLAQFYAVRVSGSDSGVKLALPDSRLKESFGDVDYTLQCYARPNATQTAAYGVFMQVGPVQLRINNQTSPSSGSYTLALDGTTTGLKVKADAYSHLTLTKKGTTYTVYVIDAAGNLTKKEFTNQSKTYTATNLGLSFGGSYASSTTNVLAGFVDEMRVYSGKALTEKEILDTYNHTLSGSEDGLYAYWPADEGFSGQTLVYDYSKTNGVANGNHATLSGGAILVSDVLPTADQLSLFAYTDAQGNYVIRGVPFTGEGTNYSVTPVMGIHEFSPHYSSRYVSASSLVHSGVDFEDVSSFPVSGVVYYENTTYPVEGCNLYVDGQICSKDGELIETDVDGSFLISVPIGSHFITIKKNGHTFVDNGRYPADPTGAGSYRIFDNEITNLQFYDNTLVNFTGRVVGGSIQGDKPVGFGLSNNNLGVAELILVPVNDSYRLNVVKKETGTSYSWESNTNKLPCASATSAIASTSWRGEGENGKYIYIDTDPMTGEFSALVPPLYYQVKSMKVKKNSAIDLGEANSVDLTNPLSTGADSLDYSDGQTLAYEYHAKMNQIYHSDATFNVWQKGRTDGSFGIDKYDYEDEIGKLTISDIYSVKNGKVTYKYGGPLFKMKDTYTFDMEGYEEYINADTKVTDHVPLEDVVVTINNAISASQEVCTEGGTGSDGNQYAAGDVVNLKSNQVQLDSLGQASYVWKAGLPNISAPYTRTIAISYDIDGRTYNWTGSGMKAIALGSLPMGTNFVTAGPDVLSMILRDPPGTNSNTEWTTGSTRAESHSKGTTCKSSTETTLTMMLGVEASIATGLGVAVISTIESKDDLTVGIRQDIEYESADTWSVTTTNTHTIATSAAPEYVGAMGDVFIGNSTNLLFGKAAELTFHRVNGGTTCALSREDVLTTGLEFSTAFSYTANYIENTLIPNIEALRNGLLTTVASQSVIKSYKNNTNHNIYLTTLKPDDDNFGAPDTYTLVETNAKGVHEDSVQWCNNQIDNWIARLADNERAKVKAIRERSTYLVDNISFDSGTGVNFSNQTDSTTGDTYDLTIEGIAIIHNELGFAYNKLGFKWDIGTETGGGTHTTTENEYTTSATFTYNLGEEGDDDAISVDVLRAPDGFSNIFYTRAGQTCNPYEGRTVTKYYEPGFVIGEATMQIEVPHIDVDEPIVVDVPSGSAASYTLQLSNASEIDEDVYYKLLVIDETNPNGAALSVDGVPLADNRIIKIPAGTTVTKSLTLKQTNTSILNYEDIGLVLASQTQYDPTSTWDVIADTVYITAQFVPSSSPVAMTLSGDVLNTFTGSDLAITFKDFDRNYHNLKAFRIQYRRQGDTGWTLIKEYVLKESDRTASNLLLPTGASVTYTLPMASFSDDKYTFRVLSVATYGTQEVSRPSEEITVTKDMARPRPLILPSPSDGILNAGDEISILFNEDLRTGSLNAADNFIVTADLNASTISHDGVFAVSGTEGAKTSASIDLSSRPFAFNFWLKWSGAGTVLSHGTGFTAAVDASGHLVITNGTKSHTSTTTIPKDTWCYVGIIMDYDGGTPRLSAFAAYDASTVTLFNEVSTAVYNNRATLTVGKGITAAIHELTLWNFARTFEMAQATMYSGQTAAADGLIGYWPLNEGHGTQGADCARSRHLTLPSEGCWQMAAGGYALALDGKSYAAFNVSGASATVDDDWMVEFWFKGTVPAATATLLSAGNGLFDLRATKTGAIELEVGSTVYAISAGGALNGAWHHLAINVLKGTGGSATVYIDGDAVASMAASAMPALAADRLILGARRAYSGSKYSYSQFFTGSFDELCYWRGTVSKATILADMYTRLKGDESGLAAYYPFEKQSLDAYNQIVCSADKADHSSAAVGNAEIFTPTSSGTGSEPKWQSTVVPALKAAPRTENVAFSFVANERQIVINLEESAVRLEGSTVSFTVRDVQDRNGNNCLPVTWTAYVNQNRLTWSENEVSVRKEGTDNVTFSVDIINASGAVENWSLSGLPTWLTVNAESGSLSATGSKTLTFTVNGSTAIGSYEAVVNLTGNNGVAAQLVVDLASVSEKPDWYVDPAGYEQKMNVVARVKVDGIFSNDTEDRVAAFIEGECRGVISPEFFSRYDGCYAMLNVYGNASDADKPIVFKVFSNSTGTIYPSVTASEKVSFASGSVAGTLATPVILTTDNRQEQGTSLHKGWNWLSLFVSDKDMSPAAVFGYATPSLSQVKGKTTYAEQSGGKWAGSLTELSTGVMYKVNAVAPTSLAFIGETVNPAASPVAISEGWNWIGYNGSSYLPVDEAFADLEPLDGDVVNSLDAFAIFCDYEWVGTLNTMEPGQGYIYWTARKSATTFTYPRSANGSRQAPARRSGADAEVIYHAYPSVMCVVAEVCDGSEVLTDAIVTVLAGEEVRARSAETLHGLHFLNVQGEGRGTLLTVKVTVDGKEYLFDTPLTFDETVVVGSVREPLRLNIGDATSVRPVDGEVAPGTLYDVAGRRVLQPTTTGIYIQGGKKVLVK